MGTSSNPTLDSDEFFAAASTDKIAGLICQKIDDWNLAVGRSAQFRRMSDSLRMYYGMSPYGQATSWVIREVGPKGQYFSMNNNFYRSNIQHVLSLVCGERPAAECQAANMDPESIEECTLGNGLVDWYFRDKQVGTFMRSMAEFAMTTGEGYIGGLWQTTAGEIYDVQDGRPIYEGDIMFNAYGPLDVIRDPFYYGPDIPYATTINWVNKFNLVAKYPHMKEQILTSRYDEIYRIRSEFNNRDLTFNSDYVPLLIFMYEKCEALPQGRMVKFLNGDCKLFDGPLPYDKVPLKKMMPAAQQYTPFGYTPAFDAMGMQQGLTITDSIIMTNIKTFGVGTMKFPEGHNVRHQLIAEGLQGLVVNETNGKMEVLAMPQTPPEVYKFRDMLKSDIQEVMGINSVISGSPNANIGSGTYAALIAAQAVQFNTQLQESYTEAIEWTGNFIIENLQKFANTNRIAKIVGKNNQYMLKNFSSENLQRIKRVTVARANPFSKTTAGKMQIAQDLMKGGFIKRPYQYLQVLETGNLEPISQSEKTGLNNINRENDAIRQGKQPVVISTDNHQEHIIEHASVLDDPSVRENLKITDAGLAHILEHIQKWGATDQALLAALGRPTLQVPPQQPPQSDAGGNIAKVTDPNLVQDEELPSMPSMPENPATGQTMEGNLPSVAAESAA